MDVLSDVFASVRFSGGVFLNAEFTAPWCVVSQVEPEDFQAQGGMPAHLIAYHYIVDGRLFLSVGNTPALEVQAGEIVLLPRNDGHVLGSAPGPPAENHRQSGRGSERARPRLVALRWRWRTDAYRLRLHRLRPAG